MGFGGLMDSMGVIITLAVLAPVALIILYLMLRAFASQRRARASRNWHQTTGTVLLADVQGRRSSDSHGGYSTSYYPVVLYQYEVDGRTYQGERISFGMPVGRGSPRAVMQRLAPYTPGASVPVYYDPMNPAEAVLERTASSNRLVWLVILIMLIIVVGVLAFQIGLFGFLGPVFSGFSDMFSNISSTVAPTALPK
jgi:hypothetical protein